MITARRRKRLRKRLDASSTAAKRLSSTVFYLDESIYSRRLTDALREGGANVVTPYDGGLAGSADESWLALVGYVDQNADVTNICVGTGKTNDLQYYLTRPRHTGDMHGQAPVLWCASALLR